MSDRTKIIIDTDPGCDDTIALVHALTSPNVDVLGITSIGGNVDPLKTQKNALGICALVDRTDVPVYAGCDRPLEKKIVAKADDVHGEDGVHGLVLPFDKAAEAKTDLDAADFIIKTILANKHDPITLVVIGPMTNIAIAYQRNPLIAEHVKRIVTMGGAYGNPSGNITPFSEFNIFCDPLAADIVYRNFPNIVALPLDVTHQTLQGESFRDMIRDMGPQGKNLASMLAAYADDYPGMQEPNVSPLHDFHTMAMLEKRDLYTTDTGSVIVPHVEGRSNEGQTVFARDDQGNVKVALDVDADRFFDFLTQTLKRAISNHITPNNP
jgi:purine nucleosidase